MEKSDGTGCLSDSSKHQLARLLEIDLEGLPVKRIESCIAFYKNYKTAERDAFSPADLRKRWKSILKAIDLLNGQLPEMRRYFVGPLDSYNSALCSLEALRPAVDQLINTSKTTKGRIPNRPLDWLIRELADIYYSPNPWRIRELTYIDYSPDPPNIQITKEWGASDYSGAFFEFVEICVNISHYISNQALGAAIEKVRDDLKQ